MKTRINLVVLLALAFTLPIGHDDVCRTNKPANGLEAGRPVRCLCRRRLSLRCGS